MKTIGVSANSACEAVKRLDKHILLYEAIQRIRLINERLEDLVARIEGRPSTAEEATSADYTPPLMDVLTNGADEINSMITEAQQRIEHLNTLLF